MPDEREASVEELTNLADYFKAMADARKGAVVDDAEDTAFVRSFREETERLRLAASCALALAESTIRAWERKKCGTVDYWAMEVGLQERTLGPGLCPQEEHGAECGGTLVALRRVVMPQVEVSDGE